MLHSPVRSASIACAAALLVCARTVSSETRIQAPQKPPVSGQQPKAKKKPDAEKAIEAGLLWLARHQAPDGSWGARKLAKRCSPQPCFVTADDHDDYDVGLTGLALLAFLRTGHTPGTSKEIVDPLTKHTFDTAELVTRGLDWLRKNQSKKGEFAKSASSFVYDEAMAELAMAEAFLATKDDHWKESAQRGATALIRAQRTNPAGDGPWGWHYEPRSQVTKEESSQADTSATGWCVVALAAAQTAGLEVKKEAFQGALDYLDAAAGKDGLVGYIPDHAGEPVTGPHDEFKYHVGTMSALGIQIRLESGTAVTNSFFDLAAKQVLKDLPVVSEDKLSVDYYYWYQGSAALNRLDEVQPKKAKPAKKYAEAWNRALVETACALQDQTPDRCSLGGWVVSDRWSFAGGPVYATAMTVLALEAATPK